MIRGVLFDSGDTLIGPVGGRWNPRHDFEEVVLRWLPELDVDRFPKAFAAGQQVLDAPAVTADRRDYHRAILRALDVVAPPPALLAELERPLPAVELVEPFPEVVGVLEQLRELGVRMGIVSDNWPTIEDLYRQLGLHHFFDVFVVSALLGCRKPDPRMYAAGSDGLGLAPGGCLFVDDDPDLVSAAVELGYHGVVVARGRDVAGAVSSIPSLDDVIRIVGSG